MVISSHVCNHQDKIIIRVAGILRHTHTITGSSTFNPIEFEGTLCWSELLTILRVRSQKTSNGPHHRNQSFFVLPYVEHITCDGDRHRYRGFRLFNHIYFITFINSYISSLDPTGHTESPL